MHSKARTLEKDEKICREACLVETRLISGTALGNAGGRIEIPLETLRTMKAE